MMMHFISREVDASHLLTCLWYTEWDDRHSLRRLTTFCLLRATSCNVAAHYSLVHCCQRLAVKCFSAALRSTNSLAGFVHLSTEALSVTSLQFLHTSPYQETFIYQAVTPYFSNSERNSTDIVHFCTTQQRLKRKRKKKILFLFEEIYHRQKVVIVCVCCVSKKDFVFKYGSWDNKDKYLLLCFHVRSFRMKLLSC